MLAVQSSGWLLYAAGLMGAIAFVVVQASDAAISLGTVLMTVSLIRRSRNSCPPPRPAPARWSARWPPRTGCSGCRITPPTRRPSAGTAAGAPDGCGKGSPCAT